MGKVSAPAKRVPYGKGRSYNRKGSRAAGPRLAAEDGVSDDARCNVWKSQGPLGEGGSWAAGGLHQRQAYTARQPVNEGCGQPVWKLLGWQGLCFRSEALGIPQLMETRLCLSPDRLIAYVRWGGGGLETELQGHRACPLPDHVSQSAESVIGHIQACGRGADGNS